MNKAEIKRLIVESLVEQVAVLDKAARASHAEATHESSRAENKYDTRGLEAAYLAGGQAKQIREILASIKAYETMVLKDFSAGEPVEMSALVEVQMDREKVLYFIGPRSGGLEVVFQKKEILVLTPQSPLGEMLMGRKSGEAWTAKIGGATVKYKVVSVV